MGSCEYLSRSGELEFESGLRQLVLALLTLSRGGCRSLGSQHAIQRREGKDIKKMQKNKQIILDKKMNGLHHGTSQQGKAIKPVEKEAWTLSFNLLRKCLA